MPESATTSAMAPTRRRLQMFPVKNHPIPKVCVTDIRRTEHGEEIMRRAREEIMGRSQDSDGKKST